MKSILAIALLALLCGCGVESNNAKGGKLEPSFVYDEKIDTICTVPYPTRHLAERCDTLKNLIADGKWSLAISVQDRILDLSRANELDACQDGCFLQEDLIVYDLLASGSTDILMDFDVDLAAELLGSLADVCGYCEVWESGTVIDDVTTGSVPLGGGLEIRLPRGWAAVHKPGQYRSTDRDDAVRNFRITVLDWIRVRE
ncbi:MAG: hypothetical protein F4Z65_01785 [Acidobacteria bacterium]|nr:hypothetical protein [Acidobacteriota bacterium]MYA44763.1 hypothetical protein [Acidobacteriota bacterium]MYI40071.1 hypothetical protein [Acidobacteriota bacterium]